MMAENTSKNLKKGDFPILLVSAGLLRQNNGKILIAQRPSDKAMGDLWEFPGGKVLPNETAENALVRELAEELGIRVERNNLEPLTFAAHRYDTFFLIMPLFFVAQWNGTPIAREHQALDWVLPEELERFKMPPADEPLIRFIREKFE